MAELDGKVAIVTGADSKYGIGAASARALSASGACVVVTGIGRQHSFLRAEDNIDPDDDPPYIDELVDEIVGMGGTAMSVEVDLMYPEQIDDCIETTLNRFGSIDILVNNAATSTKGPFEETVYEDWVRVMSTNVLGTQHFCRCVIPTMKKRNGGSIINMSSGIGLGAIPNFSTYITSKFAIVGLTKAIATELGQFNIRCNALCPGIIDTYASRVSDMMVSKISGINLQELRQQNEKMIALRRYGSTKEIAASVVWLAGDDASYITGAAIPVSGGLPPGL